jgi:hypothetical protein
VSLDTLDIICVKIDKGDYMKNLMLAITLLLLPCSIFANELELNNWQKLGLGNVGVADNSTFTLSVPDLENSKGLIFLSNEMLPDNFTVSFDFKTSNPEGVLVMLLAFTSIEDEEIIVEENYDGNWAYFRDGIEHSAYAIALHTHAHQPNTFIRKIPGFDLLAQTHDPFATAGSSQWNSLTIEKNGGNIKLIRENQELLLEVNDFDGSPLGAGYLGFRLSPAENQPFEVEYRNLQIKY